ncbi:MAG: transposase [Clostridia bacterium]|nr:transposase [Clostridia bacterium]
MQNLCNIIKDLTGIKPSVGTVANMLHSAAGVANPVVDTFPQLLHQEPVVNCDETGADVNGKLHYVHVMCTKDLTYYALSKKRGKEAMDKIGFLPEYKGIVEHDFWKSYFKATKAEHAMCCAHILRELIGVFENHPEQVWAREMYMLLFDGVLEGIDEHVVYKKAQIKGGRFVYAFKDARKAAKEESTYLANAKKKNTFSPEQYAKKKNLFGVIVLESDQDLDLKVAYTCYEDRWLLELVFKRYKSDECLDCTREQGDFSVIPDTEPI